MSNRQLTKVKLTLKEQDTLTLLLHNHFPFDAFDVKEFINEIKHDKLIDNVQTDHLVSFLEQLQVYFHVIKSGRHQGGWGLSEDDTLPMTYQTMMETLAWHFYL